MAGARVLCGPSSDEARRPAWSPSALSCSPRCHCSRSTGTWTRSGGLDSLHALKRSCATAGSPVVGRKRCAWVGQNRVAAVGTCRARRRFIRDPRHTPARQRGFGRRSSAKRLRVRKQGAQQRSVSRTVLASRETSMTSHAPAPLVVRSDHSGRRAAMISCVARLIRRAQQRLAWLIRQRSSASTLAGVLDEVEILVGSDLLDADEHGAAPCSWQSTTILCVTTSKITTIYCNRPDGLAPHHGATCHTPSNSADLSNHFPQNRGSWV